MQDRLERNLVLIAWHEMLVRSNPWIAVFVLFTRERFGLDGAIQLAAVYYLSVVVFEVPSGWLSDRVGRVLTLRLAATLWIGTFVCFLLGNANFLVIAAGQALLAAGYASLSGTDVTFHYDTLESLGRQHEYADRQARVGARGLVAGAVGALTGGILGLLDLRLAFAMSLVLTLVQLGIASRFVEPPDTGVAASGIGRQVLRCLGYLRNIPLAWVFGYGVVMVVLEHVAFTLLQPWLTEALDRTADDVGSTPLLAGATVAVTALVGAVFARSSVRLGRRFGLRATLVALGALSATIVTAMAVSTHVAILALIAFRSAQGSAAPVLISAAVAPMVEASHRATFLSIDSLAGRLSYGALLLVVSADTSDDVGAVLVIFAAIAWGLVTLTLLTAMMVRRRLGDDPALVG